MRVNRELFLNALESTQAGLDPKGLVEQSRSFVFHNGHVMTYNDEIFCRRESGLDQAYQGAVDAKPLLKLIQKLEEEELDIDMTNGELAIRGVKKKAGVRMDKEISSPLMLVDLPKKWLKFHPDLMEAIKLVVNCSGSDETAFSMTCVHFHPKWVEACDDIQMCRWKIKTGLESDALVRGKALKEMLQLGMTEMALDDRWLHFRGPQGLSFSCRRYLVEYQDLGPMLEVSGEPLVLPKDLKECIDKAKLFSEDNVDTDLLQIDVKPNKIKVKGSGASGWYEERKTTSYAGKPLTFFIAPIMLEGIVSRHNECFVNTDKLKVQGQHFIYVSCLMRPDELDKEIKEEKE